MGNMACCGKSEADPNNLITSSFDTKGFSGIKISTIVLIQAHMRGFMARKRVRRIRNTNGSAAKSMMYYNNLGN